MDGWMEANSGRIGSRNRLFFFSGDARSGIDSGFVCFIVFYAGGSQLIGIICCGDAFLATVFTQVFL